ncbi:hypothetical protein H4582DRAFT_2082076 [Lactarius indigo]|nr:hypothetical protein H4582DRAFT_2082076 [Lactarius indigo]
MDKQYPLTTTITADQLPVQWTFKTDDKQAVPAPLVIKVDRHAHLMSTPSPSLNAAQPDEVGQPIVTPDHDNMPNKRTPFADTTCTTYYFFTRESPYFRRLWKVEGSMAEKPIDLSNDEPISIGNDATATPYYVALSKVPRGRSPHMNNRVCQSPQPQTVYAQLTTPNESDGVHRLYHPRMIHARPTTSDEPEPEITTRCQHKDNVTTAAAHEPTPTIAAIATVSDTPKPSVANPTLGAPHNDVAPFHLTTPITDSSALHRRLRPLAHVLVHGYATHSPPPGQPNQPHTPDAANATPQLTIDQQTTMNTLMTSTGKPLITAPNSFADE